MLKKGNNPSTYLDLCKKLEVIWSSLAVWKVISLGKEFYLFEFSSLKDMCYVLVMDLWNLSPGLLRNKDFVSTFIKLANAQCWIRIHGLPLE